ncbi:MAG: lysylphosphatidylglycerol synthase transmembrane domain-containing protein [Sandaracinaceae bacterium]
MSDAEATGESGESGESDASQSSADAPSASGDRAREQGVLRSILPKLLISIGLGAIFVYVLNRLDVDIIPDAGDFATVRWWTVGAYVGVLALTHFFRASRWRFLIRPVDDTIPFWDGVLLNWIGFFAIFALPLRLGELARPALTKIRHGVSISAGVGTVAVERVIDGLVTSLCVMWALFAIPHLAPDDDIVRALPFYGTLAVSVFAAAFGGLLLFLWQRALAVKLIDLTFGLVSKRLASVVAEKVGSVAQGVRSLAEPRLAFGFITETLAYWTLNAAGMWLLAWGCGLDVGFQHAVAMMGILAIGILLPAAPGLFGSFQLALATALRLYFVEQIVTTRGDVYIFLLFVVQSLLICAFGIVPLYAMKLRFSDLLRTRAS